MTHVAVMGAGSWGTTFARLLADAGCTVTMWARRPEIVAQINQGCNVDYRPDVDLPRTVRATGDALAACAGADMVVLTVPSQTLRDNLEAWGSAIPGGVPVVSLMKGVELGTTKRMSEVIAEVGSIEPERIVVISGPNLAPEIAARQPAASVIACTDPDTAAKVATTIATPYFRPYTNTDVVGTELCGATKNVVALAVGMAEGMGYGDNTKATIITRGLAETTRLGLALGADAQTFLGLAGVGDLIATCMSPLSRNHAFGLHLGEGMAVEEVVAITKQTAEGVKSCQSILELGRQHGVELPIVEQVVAVVRDGQPVTGVAGKLMSRTLKPEAH